MARIRYIKPGFFDNEDLAECSPLARLLAIGLPCWADRRGRIEDRPKRLKKQILGFDDCDVNALLDELQSYGFIQRYGDENGKYIQILGFQKHQRPHFRERESDLPAPEGWMDESFEEDAEDDLGQAQAKPDKPRLVVAQAQQALHQPVGNGNGNGNGNGELETGESEGGPPTFSVVADTAGSSQDPTILDQCVLAVDCKSDEWDRKFRLKLRKFLEKGRSGASLLEQVEDAMAVFPGDGHDWKHKYNYLSKRLSSWDKECETAENVARNNRIPNIGPSQEDLDWAAQLNADALARAPENKRRHEEQLRARRIG